MDPATYRRKWRKLTDGRADPDELHHLARQVAFSFIDRHFQSGAYVAEYIDLLCEMATFHTQADLNNIASSALFEIVIEKLCDDFEELPVEVYCRVMCQVISFCRTLPAGRTLDARLTDFGVASSAQLFERAVRTHTRRHRWETGKAPRRIILLSRVTIGADVAILSVLAQRLHRLFPEADFVVIGSRKLEGLFGGNLGIRIKELSYARRGGLLERFASWHAALHLLRDELADVGEQDTLIVDPDSRITQLGALPLMHADNYLFLNTRDHALTANGRCMAEWTNDWIDAVFGVAEFAYPTVWVPPIPMQAAASEVEALRAAGARHIVAMNLGVGQNPRKRVGLEFEKRLLRALVAIPGTVIILDRGFGADEEERCALLMADMRTCGFPTAAAPFAALDTLHLSHGVLAVECGIGEMAALIAHSDEYLGYDSACQHIAAAARTPTLTIFAGSNNKNFVRRWSACGDTDCRIVHVNTLSNPAHIDVNEVISRIMEERATRASQARLPRIREIGAGRTADRAAQETTKT